MLKYFIIYHTMNILENYKPQYRNRVYYPNRCNLCFSKEKLMKCGSCLAVMYCSREHQMEDWPFHKPTCKALQRIKQKVAVPKNCDEEKFYRYRTALIYQLTKLRNLTNKHFLTTYEYQICTLPWVCLVCFVSPTNKFECTNCQSVVYCSLEHMKMDSEEHKTYCWPWTLSRFCNSLPYEHGYKIKAQPHRYEGIKSHTHLWPQNKLALCNLIQSGIKSVLPLDVNEFMNLNLFIEPYVPAAIIINLLEKTGFIRKRRLIDKSKDSKKNYGNSSSKWQQKFVQFKKKSTLTIHFPIADDYELSFNWNKIARLLTDWIKNIDKVVIVLIGSSLEHCVIPPYENQEKVEVKVYRKAYNECEDLPKPDVIILLECFRARLVEEKRKWLRVEFIEALFQFRYIPVIFCDGRSDVIEEIYECFYELSGTKFICTPVWPNPFTGLKILRKWDDRMTTFVENDRCFVLLKC